MRKRNGWGYPGALGPGVALLLLVGFTTGSPAQTFEKEERHLRHILLRTEALADKVIAEIDQSTCIHCGLCYIGCEDGCHQSIEWKKVPLDDYLKQHGGIGEPIDAATAASFRSGGVTVVPGAGDGVINKFTIKQDTCVGCNMCSLICPVEGCITMKQVDTGQEAMNWRLYQDRLAAGEMEPIKPPEHA